MKTFAVRCSFFATALLTLLTAIQGAVVNFSTGSTQFSIDFVTIGAQNNPADTRPSATPNAAGRVGYVFGIGKFEVSRDMITKYNSAFGTANSLGLTLADMTPYGGNGASQPATGLSWNEAARFVNWLNTVSGGTAAYNFSTGGVNDNITPWSILNPLDYDPMNPYRSKRAIFALPSDNEWYKAAYYNPVTNGYSDYPSLNGMTPAAVSGGTTDNTAVYFQPGGNGPAVIDSAGGLSPFGVMGLGGNVREWEESSIDLLNNNGSSIRGIRGGTWFDGPSYLSSSARYDDVDPNGKNLTVGFRVVSLSSAGGEVPEPSTMAIIGLCALGMAYRAQRRSKS